MTRLIDADALNREIDKVECYSRDPYVTYMSECIANAPTVDAEPVRHGKWCEGTECYSDDFIVCSVCGEAFNVMDNDTYRFDYCPKCGARMVEE